MTNPDESPDVDDVELPDAELPDGEPDVPATPPFAQILEALGLPADARAVVITPTSAVAIAADYPEPHTMPEPEEAHDGH